VRVGLIALGCNMALNVLVVLPAQHFGFPYPHILIATSTCIAAAINTTLLWRGLVRAGVYKPRPGWSVLLARIVFANAVMAALLIWLGGDIAGWLAASPLQRAARLAMCVAAGAVAYFAALFISGLRLRHMRSSGA
jgi:putative peptidoglycan lipid II flippase